jgi:hypothetical protein
MVCQGVCSAADYSIFCLQKCSARLWHVISRGTPNETGQATHSNTVQLTKYSLRGAYLFARLESSGQVVIADEVAGLSRSLLVSGHLDYDSWSTPTHVLAARMTIFVTKLILPTTRRFMFVASSLRRSFHRFLTARCAPCGYGNLDIRDTPFLILRHADAHASRTFVCSASLVQSSIARLYLFLPSRSSL